MTNEGLMSLCLALQKIEAVATRPVPGHELPRVRIRFASRLADQHRPKIIGIDIARKPVQSEFDWPTNQLRLFDGVG